MPDNVTTLLGDSLQLVATSDHAIFSVRPAVRVTVIGMAMGPGLTKNVPLTPACALPVAVIVTAAPDLLNVTLWPESTPAVNALDVAGLTVPPAPLPVSVKSTVPVKPDTVLLFASCAVIVAMANAVPAVCVPGVVTAK